MRVLTPQIQKLLTTHVREYCSEKGIFFLEMGGFLDHCHLLVDVPPSVSVADAVNLIKGESSHWINSVDLLPGKFAWQSRYGAFSVSASHRIRVAKYIRDQEIHHRKITFEDEIQKLIKKYGDF